MIAVEKLLEPKKTSGRPLLPGKTIRFDDLSVMNRGSQTYYVRPFARKDRPKKKAKKGPKPQPVTKHKTLTGKGAKLPIKKPKKRVAKETDAL